jgi:hypothetical protein
MTNSLIVKSKNMKFVYAHNYSKITHLTQDLKVIVH